MRSPAAFIASLKPSVRCCALRSFGGPSMMPTSSPAFSFEPRYAPTSFAPRRLSGPTNGIVMFAASCAASSNGLSIAITMMPAPIAFAATGSSAFESAGAMTIALTFASISVSTMWICPATSLSVSVPFVARSSCDA